MQPAQGTSTAGAGAVMVAIVVAARVEGEEKMTTMPPAEVAEGSMPRTPRGGEEGMDIRPTQLLC